MHLYTQLLPFFRLIACDFAEKIQTVEKGAYRPYVLEVGSTSGRHRTEVDVPGTQKETNFGINYR